MNKLKQQFLVIKYIVMNKLNKRYRIVTDSYAGCEVQVSYLCIPIWFQVGINTFPSIRLAEMYINSINRQDSTLKQYIYTILQLYLK